MSAEEKDLKNFLRVYEEMEGTIFRTIMRYSNNNYHVAQDITQEVFLKVYNYFDTYEEEYLLQWAIVIAKNMTLNYIKRAAREIPDQNITLTSDLREYELGTEELVFERLDCEETHKKTEDILDSLYERNERWYEAVTLVYIAGMKHKDVAKKIGISLGSLEAILYRAKKKIKEDYRWKLEE